MRFPKLRLLLVCAVACGLAASAAAQISGKLVLGAYKPAPPKAQRAGFNWELENGVKEVRPDRIDARRELAVVLLGEGEPPPGWDRVEITFSGGNLMPSTIAVRAGVTMLIRNDDEIAHELSATGLDALAAEATSPRGRRSVNLKDAGHWSLSDKIVPHVAGHLHVLPNLIAVASCDAEGQFSFKGVPPGKYVLKVFHAARELVSQEVELGTQDLTVDPITLTGPTDSK